MDIEKALHYICDHQFDLDSEMRAAIFSVMNDREKKRRELMDLAEWLENHISKMECIEQRVIGMRKRLDCKEVQNDH